MENEKPMEKCPVLCPCIKCFFTYFGMFSICFPSGLCSDKYEWLKKKDGDGVGKPKMIGIQKPYTPNSKAKNPFQKKGKGKK